MAKIQIPIILNRNCAKCGKQLVITKNEDGSYSGGSYLGKVKLGIGEQATYELKNGKFKRSNPIWKHIYFRLKDFKRLLFRQYEEQEIWFCENCDIDEEKNEDYD